MNPGIAHNSVSNMDGGGWIGPLIQAVGGIVQSGFQFGATKDTNKAMVEAQRLQGQAATWQAGYGALGNDTSTELLAAALGKNFNAAPASVPQESAFSKNLLPLVLLAGAVIIVVVFVMKSDAK